MIDLFKLAVNHSKAMRDAVLVERTGETPVLVETAFIECPADLCHKEAERTCIWCGKKFCKNHCDEMLGVCLECKEQA